MSKGAWGGVCLPSPTPPRGLEIHEINGGEIVWIVMQKLNKVKINMGSKRVKDKAKAKVYA